MTESHGERVPSDTPTGQLERHLARLEGQRQLLAPAVASALGAAMSFVLEIGCGHGHFLASYAQAHPNAVCLGVDIASDRIARAERKRGRAGLANLHFIRAEAEMLLDVLPPAVRIAAVFILFPDPWPKLRHHKHRVARPRFLGRLADRLGEGGRIYFRTDHEPYFKTVYTELSVHPQLEIAAEPWAFEHPTVFQNRAATFHSLVAKPRPPPAPSA